MKNIYFIKRLEILNFGSDLSNLHAFCDLQRIQDSF